MAMFPKQVANHPGKYLAVREWPIRCCQSRVVTGDIRAGNNEKERRDCHQQCEAMNSTGHKDFGLQICDCGNANPQFAIRNPQFASSVFSNHRKLDCRQHSQRAWLSEKLSRSAKSKVSGR